MTVPTSKATLAVNLNSLRNIPPGVKVSERNGRATASIEVKGDSLFAHATCDSLKVLVWEYEKQLSRLQAKQEQKTLNKESGALPVSNETLYLLLGIGIVILIIILRLKR